MSNNKDYCGQMAPRECIESRKHLLNTLKNLANQLDKGCCDECCPDTPFKRKEKVEEPNPCLGMFPSRATAVPPGVNPNKRGRTQYQPRVTVDGRTVNTGTNLQPEDEFDRYDDCLRSECGTDECLYRPPECDASTFSPHTGLRIPNMMSNEYHNYNLYC